MYVWFSVFIAECEHAFWWIYFLVSDSLGKILFQVNNKGTSTHSVDVVLVFLLLTMPLFLPTNYRIMLAIRFDVNIYIERSWCFFLYDFFLTSLCSLSAHRRLWSRCWNTKVRTFSILETRKKKGIFVICLSWTP